MPAHMKFRQLAVAILDRFQNPSMFGHGARAAAAHMSARTVQRLFIRHRGESVGRYVQRLRLAHACRHLVGTDWPIATVAARCGIPNAANFNRQFLAARGMTPGAYRQFFVRHGHAPDDDAPALDTRPPSLEHRADPARK